MATNHTKERKNKENQNNPEQRLIVIGASAGGFEAIKKIVRGLPADFDTPIFIVWHLSPDVQGVLPQVLNHENKIYAAHGIDYEPIKSHRIYVAPPDHHMLVEDGIVRVTHGPKENLFRPAIDPLFRSSAYHYNNRVIGVILSGALDDGTAGLWEIKHHGGITVVQEPNDAEVSSMPESALREVKVDYCLPVAEMADLLVCLSKQPVKKMKYIEDSQTLKEIESAIQVNAMDKGKLKFEELTPYTCPECHGVLSRLHNDNIIRYRCHTGHAYSTETLMLAISERIEDSLYNVIRGMDENIILLNHIGDHYAESNQPKLAAGYFQKAKEAEERAELVRKAVIGHEQLSKNKFIKELAEDTETE
jgi:two-component system chemotaxis response regulator CheB